MSRNSRRFDVPVGEFSEGIFMVAPERTTSPQQKPHGTAERTTEMVLQEV